MTARSERASDTGKQAPSPTGAASVAASGAAESAAALLARVEKLIGTQFPPMRADFEPMLEQVRQGLAELFPSTGGRQLAPPEQQKAREQLGVTLDTLEDILEALQHAARARRHPGPRAGPRET